MAIAPSVQASTSAAASGGTGASAARGGGDGSLFAALLQITGASGPETSSAAGQLLGAQNEGDLAALLEKARALIESGDDVSLEALLQGQAGGGALSQDAMTGDAGPGADGTELAAALAAAINIDTRAPATSGDTDPGSAGGSADDPPTSPTVSPAAADADTAIVAATNNAPGTGPGTTAAVTGNSTTGIALQAGGLDAALARFAGKGEEGSGGAQKTVIQGSGSDAEALKAAAGDAPDTIAPKTGAEGGRGDRQSGTNLQGDTRPAPQITIRAAGVDGQSALLQLQQIDASGQQSASQTIAVPVAALTANAQTPAATPYGGAAAAVPLNTIAVEITRQANAGNSRFQIRLDPPELGRIDVRLDLASDGRIHTHLKIDNPETFDAIQRDPRALERALQNAGLKVDDGSVQVSLRDSGGFMQRQDHDNPNFQSFQQSAAAYGADAWSEDEETVVEAWRIAPAGGGLDMRV